MTKKQTSLSKVRVLKGMLSRKTRKYYRGTHLSGKMRTKLTN